MSKHFELMQQLEKERSVGEERYSTQSPSAGVRSTAAEGQWATDEALRLVQQVFLLQAQEPPRVVVFAGIDHGNGCSQMAASVAETLARNSSKSVCLVEGNFRSPALPQMFRTTNHHGLTDSLLQTGPIQSFTKEIDAEKLWLLSSGTLASDSANLLASARLGERFTELRETFDFVIVDAPPLTKYSDAIVLGQQADGLVVVLEANATRRESASVAIANVRSANVPILAAVLNKRTFPIPQKLYNLL
jgi:receptor protein-tyrosine kinase